MGKKFISEEIQITQRTPAMVRTNSTTTIDTEIWTYQIPADSEVNVRPNDFLGMLLQTAPATPFITFDPIVTVLMTDAYNRRSQVIAQGEYGQFVSMNDVTLKYFMKAKYTIPAFWFLRIRLLAVQVSTALDSRFTLSCQLVYGTIS